MKYFRKDLWAAINSANDAESAMANAEWDKNLQLYWKQLEDLLPRLSKNAQRFFKRVHLHDGTMLSFSAGDYLGASEKDILRKIRRRLPLRVICSVLSPAGDFIYQLRYSGVRKCIVDCPSDQPLFLGEPVLFDDWGYDELTNAGSGYFRHEVLFSSGATILVEFRSFSYSRQRVKT